jgi:sulfur carrier protein
MVVGIESEAAARRVGYVRPTCAAIAAERIPVADGEVKSGARSGAGARPRAAATLVVNGDERVLDLPCTVAVLLDQLGLAGKRVAVSVDRSVIPRSRHPEAIVRAGDRVEILEAVGGG